MIDDLYFKGLSAHQLPSLSVTSEAASTSTANIACGCRTSLMTSCCSARVGPHSPQWHLLQVHTHLMQSASNYPVIETILILKLRCKTGHILYHGPRSEVMSFFKSLGFDIPPRKGIPDFLQEVSGKKDQEVSPAQAAFCLSSTENMLMSPQGACL